MKFRTDKTKMIRMGAKSKEGGIAKQRFRKDIITVGEFIKGEDEYSITLDVLEHWATTFAKMKANGVKIPIPNTHDVSGDPDKNRGWVVDMFVEEESLVMICDLIGDDAIKAASRCDVSIYSPKEFVDGKGVKYVQPIEHVALVTDPVIPGLGEFITIAASRKQENETMKWDKIAEALGIKADEMTEKTAEGLICSAAENFGKASKKDAKAIKANLKTIEELKEEVKATPTKKEKPATPDPQLVSLSVESRDMHLSALVDAERITPAVKDKLTEIFVGEDNEALILSLQNGTADTFKKVCKALADNDVVALREKSGPQTRKLSRNSDDENKNPILEDANRRREAAAKA